MGQIAIPCMLIRGMQGGGNPGKAMTYGGAYQRLFSEALEALA